MIHKAWNSLCALLLSLPSLSFLFQEATPSPRISTGTGQTTGIWELGLDTRTAQPASSLLPVLSHHGGSQLVLHQHSHGHLEAALVEAGGEEGAVLGPAALVDTELIEVAGAAARGQQDVHQRPLLILRVPPACKETPARSDRARGSCRHGPKGAGTVPSLPLGSPILLSPAAWSSGRCPWQDGL